ncbi:MAG: Crp/Fnr family transcriptional regulator [Lachnospiraceae bacterium]|nr:Crp/Fnr family transcriptional regulator [Lachnospiraceae bacterium]
MGKNLDDIPAKVLSRLSQVDMFRAVTKEEFHEIKEHVKWNQKSYKKGEIIFYAGDETDYMGIVTEGSVNIENNDLWGNRSIIGHVEEGEIFGETYALLANEPMMVDVIASEKSQILFINLRALISSDNDKFSWQAKVKNNLLIAAVNKNRVLSNRIFQTSPKTIRGKVSVFLTNISIQKKSRNFDIPFDRQELADYLNVDRSALSKELGKMKREGLLDFSKNHFKIKDLSE